MFQTLWEELKDSVTDSEIRARVIGVDVTMSKLNFLFGLLLAEKLLQHTDNLSKTLQTPSLTAVEGQKLADLTCKTPGRICNTEAFNLFWERVQQLQREFEVNHACLPRKSNSSAFGGWRITWLSLKHTKGMLFPAIL